MWNFKQLKAHSSLMSRLIFFLGALGILALLLRFCYTDDVLPASDRNPGNVSCTSDEGTVGNLLDGTTIRQTFTSSRNDITGFSLMMDTYFRRNDSHILVSFYDLEQSKAEPLRTWDILCTGIKNLEDLEFYFAPDTPVLTDTKGKQYAIEVTSVGGTYEDSVTVHASQKDRYKGGSLSIDGKKTNRDLCFAVYSSPFPNVVRNFKILAFSVMAAAAVLLGLLLFRELPLEKWFLILASVFGLLYIMLIPPLAAPDDYSHFNSAYYYSNQMMGQDGANEEGKTYLRKEDTRMGYEARGANLEEHLAFYDNFFQKRQTDGTTTFENGPLKTPSYNYWLPAAGITLARILDLGKYPLMVFGKLFAFAGYAAACYFAIRLIPFGKLMMFIIALLPISLQQATSFSYDSVVNGLSFLLIGYTLYLAYGEKEKITWKNWLILAVLSMLLAPSKVVYVLLAFLCLLIPRKRCALKRSYYLGAGAVILGAAASLLIYQAVNISTMVSHAGKTDDVIYYSPSYFIAAPEKLLGMFVRTFQDYGDSYYYTMIGGNMSYLDISITWLPIIGFGFLICLGVFADMKETRFMGTLEKGWCFLISAGVIGATMLALLFDCTPQDSFLILGVQGRYFLPVLPLLALMLRNRRLVLRKNINREVLIAFVLLHMIVILQFYSKMIAR